MLQQTRDNDLMLVDCWATAYDVGQELNRHFHDYVGNSDGNQTHINSREKNVGTIVFSVNSQPIFMKLYTHYF